MAHFRDLTSYSYSNFDHGNNTYNIGWLGSNIKNNLLYQRMYFSTLIDGDDIKSFLFELCNTKIINKMRGYHDCPFCKNAKGNGEVVLKYRGNTFIAPQLLYHYIYEHGYRPPRIFIEAVRYNLA